MLQSAINIFFFNQNMKKILTHKSMRFFGAQEETSKKVFQAWKNYYGQALDLLEMDL